MCERSRGSSGVAAAEEAFLKKHGKVGGFTNWKKIIYREGVVEEGEVVAVTGQAVREPDPRGVLQASGYRALPPGRLRMQHTRRAPLLISDLVRE